MKSEAFVAVLKSLSEAEFNQVLKLVELEIDRRAPKSPEDLLVAALKGSESPEGASVQPKVDRKVNINPKGVELLDCHIGTKFRIGKSKRLNVLKAFKNGKAVYQSANVKTYSLDAATKVTVTK